MSSYSHILIDGNNLARKNFYTHRDLRSVVHGKHVRTGVAFGCLTSLVSMKKRWLNDKGIIIVVWDRGYTRKAKIYPDYKRQRRENRDETEYKDYETQRKLFEQLLKYTSFHSAYAQGEEADDVIATLSVTIRQHQKKARILIVSSDRDLHQLVGTDVHQMVISNKGKQTIWGPTEIKEAYGIKSPQDYLAIQLLTGDSGDGVPGIRGIGPKTAVKLIQESSDTEIQGFCSSHILTIPTKVEEWLVKKAKLPASKVESFLERQADFFAMTLALLKPKSDISSVKFVRGEKNEDRLTDLFVEYDFMSLLKGNKVRELVT